MLAVLAEFERDMIAERTRSAMQYKRARGERISREAAYGFRLHDGRVVADAGEQRAVALVAKLHGAGHSLRQIGAYLDAAGIPPRSGGRWHPQTVARIVAEVPASKPPERAEEPRMEKRRPTTPQVRRTRAGRDSAQPATHTPVTSLRIPPALLARADELVPLVASTGELINPVRATVLRLALAEGLRLLARRYGRE